MARAAEPKCKHSPSEEEEEEDSKPAAPNQEPNQEQMLGLRPQFPAGLADCSTCKDTQLLQAGLALHQLRQSLPLWSPQGGLLKAGPARPQCGGGKWWQGKVQVHTVQQLGVKKHGPSDKAEGSRQLLLLLLKTVLHLTDLNARGRTLGHSQVIKGLFPWNPDHLDHQDFGQTLNPVSYTHLTLPTNREV